MNIYQRRIIEASKIEIDNLDASIIFENEKFVIKQSTNPYIEKYKVIIKNPAIISLEIDKMLIKKEKDGFHMTLDFLNKNQKIKINFIDNIAETLILPIHYVENSKEEWDEKNKINKWKELEPKAKIKVSTGIDLVNIYFQPCTEDYGKTIVELFTANGEWSKHPMVLGRGEKFVPILISAKIDKLMGKFTVEDGMYFKSINGLAFGAYGIRVSQYSLKNELLFTSDYQYFAIQDK